MRAKVVLFCHGGLGGRSTSRPIMYGLADECRDIDGVEVRVGLYEDFERHADEARALPEEIEVAQVGHSLGASCAGEFARRARRKIAAIFGFDAADNPFANPGRYGLTPIPANVINATSVLVPGGFLGGGGYEAEPGNKVTFIRNEPMPGATHVGIARAVKRHFLITEFVRRLTEA